MVQVYTYNGVAEVDMLQLAGCIEQVSSHPLAIAIVGRAAASHVSLNLCVNSTQTVSGVHHCQAHSFKITAGKWAEGMTSAHHKSPTMQVKFNPVSP